MDLFSTIACALGLALALISLAMLSWAHIKSTRTDPGDSSDRARIRSVDSSGRARIQNGRAEKGVASDGPASGHAPSDFADSDGTASDLASSNRAASERVTRVADWGFNIGIAAFDVAVIFADLPFLGDALQTFIIIAILVVGAFVYLLAVGPSKPRKPAHYATMVVLDLIAAALMVFSLFFV